jgi:hypothetical protein
VDQAVVVEETLDQMVVVQEHQVKVMLAVME